MIPAKPAARLELANARPANGPVIVDSRSSRKEVFSTRCAFTDCAISLPVTLDLVANRPPQPTVRLHPNGSSRPSGGSASTTPIQATNATSVSGSLESPSSRAQKRQSEDFRDTDLYRKLQASKKKRGPRPLGHQKPDSTGSTGNSNSARAATGVTDTDGESPSPMVNTAEPNPNHPVLPERRTIPGMDLDRVATAAQLPPRVSMAYEPRGASPATRTIVPQNRKDLPRPSVASHSSVIPNRGTPNAAPTPPVPGTFYVPKTGPVVAESSRPSFANGPSQTAPKPAETHKVVAPPSVKRSERSPSFEILDQETFVQRTTPSKKRKLSTFPPNDTASPSNLARPVVATTAPAATDLSGQEVELLNGIEEHAEAVPMDLLESLLEDEDMTRTAPESKTASDRATAPVATTSANVSAQSGADSAGRTGARKAPQISGWTDLTSQVQKHPGSLAEAMRGVANGSVNAQSLSSASRATATAAAVAPSKTASITAAALGEKYPASVINLNVNVPPNTHTPAVSQSSGKMNGKAPIFKVPHPVDTSLKGKEPVRPRVPFERKASPPIPLATTADRQELWKKQALTSNAGAMPKDVDSVLHNGHKDDDPFVVGKQGQNAEAGPSFKHPPVPESAHIHMLPEPRGSEGMTKDFDYRKFNEPLLDCINSLPDHAQNPSHIRVILEAYYSQSTLDRAPAIKIDGGEYDEYPPPEFKYSDEVYYSEKVPKPWLGKGCECVGPCSENSDCFCLKRQEMYFASYITDPFAGPLKGFAHNE
jgi:hypothetical protein